MGKHGRGHGVSQRQRRVIFASGPISSSPASGAAPLVASFAIPSGIYSSAKFLVNVTASGLHTETLANNANLAHSFAFFGLAGNGVDDSTGVDVSVILADINAAAGGSISFKLTSTVACTVNSWTLTLA